MLKFFIALCGVIGLLQGGDVWAQKQATWIEPRSGIEFIRIDKGCFQMGTNFAGSNEQGGLPAVPASHEVPRHEVCVDAFWLGKLEVTNEQWQKIMGPVATPAKLFSQLPALKVSWEDAQEFLLRLNAGLEAGGTRVRYRLPTEAEWEYACFAGESGDLDYGLDNMSARMTKLLTVAWYKEPQRYQTAARNVGEMVANAWGLHDMLGNAAEWVQDSYSINAYSQRANLNPLMTLDNGRHVLRGGSFRSEERNVRCGARNYGLLGDKMGTVGLRVVKIND